MAHIESGPISGNSYELGEYTITIQNVVADNERVIQAHISGPEGTAAKGITLPSNAKFDGWCVEANSTEASVYATVEVPVGDEGHTSPLMPEGVSIPSVSGSNTGEWIGMEYSGQMVAYTSQSHGRLLAGVFASSFPGVGRAGAKNLGQINWFDVSVSTPYTYDNKTVYYASYSAGYPVTGMPAIAYADDGIPFAPSWIAWTMVYGTPTGGDEYETVEQLIARFKIDLHEADGTGPGSPWIDPDDWNEDPYTVLKLTATGALSGRHNDPIFEPLFSYTPAPKETVKAYGCGGDGGNGGGGGAGASTVIVYDFATDKANSKDVQALAMRHGYGSGGGAGGKGGDGCILVYY